MTAFQKLLFVLFSLPAALSAHAASAGGDFSATTNPNGPWRYGWTTTLGGSFTIFTQTYADSGIGYWYGPLPSIPNFPGFPLVGYNPGPSDVELHGATVPAGEMTLHPGPTGEFAVVRYAAPASETITLAAAFSRQDHDYPTTTDVHVLLNGNPIFDGTIDTVNGAASFSSVLRLSPGDLLEFAVGFGANGNYFGDTTGLVATLDATPAVPEPATVALLVAGLCTVAGRSARRQARA